MNFQDQKLKVLQWNSQEDAEDTDGNQDSENESRCRQLEGKDKSEKCFNFQGYAQRDAQDANNDLNARRTVLAPPIEGIQMLKVLQS